MKTYLGISIFSLLLFVLMACEDQETIPEEVEVDELVGTWTIESATYKVLGIRQTGDVSGTITFNEDGTGKNDYTFTIRGVTRIKEDEFNWEHDGAIITFDKDTEFENQWTWGTGADGKRQANFKDEVPNTTTEVDVTVVLSK